MLSFNWAVLNSGLTVLKMFASSTNNTILEYFNTEAASFIQRKSNNGERWSPSGTSDVTGKGSDEKFAILIIWNLFDKKEYIQDNIGFTKPYNYNLKIKSEWSTQSNAF